MSQSLPLFRRIARNVLWYVEDVIAAVTGRGRPFHFVYGRNAACDVNPTTGQPMTPNGVDVTGRLRGSALGSAVRPG